jgi:hypothetical protein
MPARLRSLAITSVIGALLMGSSCAKHERYLVPDGYIGPVTVVYSSSEGELLQYDSDGVVAYRIGSGGALRVQGVGPLEGPVRAEYFYVTKSGTRTPIPWEHDSADVLQAFDVQVGSVAETRWLSFLVGVPRSRSDWSELRLRHLERAVNLEGQLMPEANQGSVGALRERYEER